MKRTRRNTAYAAVAIPCVVAIAISCGASKETVRASAGGVETNVGSVGVSDVADETLTISFPEELLSGQPRQVRRVVAVDDDSYLLSPGVDVESKTSPTPIVQRDPPLLVEVTAGHVTELEQPELQPNQFISLESAVKQGEKLYVLASECTRSSDVAIDMPESWDYCEKEQPIVYEYDNAGKLGATLDVSSLIDSAITAVVLHGPSGSVSLAAASNPTRLFASGYEVRVWDLLAEKWIERGAFQGIAMDATALWVCSTSDGTLWAVEGGSESEAEDGPRQFSAALVRMGPDRGAVSEVEGSRRDGTVRVWLDCGASVVAANFDNRTHVDPVAAADGMPGASSHNTEFLIVAPARSGTESVELSELAIPHGSPTIDEVSAAVSLSDVLYVLPNSNAPARVESPAVPIDLSTLRPTGSSVEAAPGALNSGGFALADGRFWTVKRTSKQSIELEGLG